MVKQSKSNQEAARAWFEKGDSDLRSARALLALDPPEAEAVACNYVTTLVSAEPTEREEE